MSFHNNKAPNTPDIAYTHSGLSHTGQVRTRNEDSFICLPEQRLWVVADGMGGHEAGDFASQTITQQAAKFSRQPTLESSILLLEENFLHSNQLIREKASKLGKQATIGSTVVSLFIWDNLAFVLWAGDSRVYRYRDGNLHRLTEDHSFVEELVRMGKLEPEEAEKHPAANVVLNAIGIEDSLLIDMEYYEIQQDDLFIICTDGLYKDLTDDRISTLLSEPQQTLEELNQSLIDAAQQAGGNDNCTVILVKAEIGEQNV